jgi:hypothetical protein
MGARRCGAIRDVSVRHTPASRFSTEFVRIMDNYYPPTNAGMSGKGLAATIHLDDVLSADDSGEFDVFLLLLLRRSSIIADMMMSPLYELL